MKCRRQRCRPVGYSVPDRLDGEIAVFFSGEPDEAPGGDFVAADDLCKDAWSGVDIDVGQDKGWGEFADAKMNRC